MEPTLLARTKRDEMGLSVGFQPLVLTTAAVSCLFVWFVFCFCFFDRQQSSRGWLLLLLLAARSPRVRLRLLTRGVYRRVCGWLVILVLTTVSPVVVVDDGVALLFCRT